jgi:hypothetical protein
VAIGRVRSGLGSDGSGRINLSGHGLSSGRFGSGQIRFQVEHYRFFSSLGSFRVGSGRISSSNELRSFRASGHSGPGQVGFRVI